VSDGDIQRLEARIAALENQARGQFVAPGGGGGAGGGPGGSTPAEWIGGLIAQNFPPGGPVQQPGGAQAQRMAGDFTGSSICWCESRFVCATMQCGGSGWC
jgi:hypothetical protein